MPKAPLKNLSEARILVSNDDGIHAPGLKVLERVARSLSKDVWVIAPEARRSSSRAFRSAGTDLGQALLASSADARWWLAGSIRRDEWNGGNAAEMHLEDAALAA